MLGNLTQLGSAHPGKCLTGRTTDNNVYGLPQWPIKAQFASEFLGLDLADVSSLRVEGLSFCRRIPVEIPGVRLGGQFVNFHIADYTESRGVEAEGETSTSAKQIENTEWFSGPHPGDLALNISTTSN